MLEFNDQEAGMLLNITGDGKGKTTSALGIALRALGWGRRVAIWQFLKSDRETGEHEYFRRFHPEIFWKSCGLGLTTEPGDHAACARRGWAAAREFLRNFDGDLLILDELNVALAHRYLECAEVVDALRNRPKKLNVVVTGRNAPPELLEISDLVSEIHCVRHPYQRGIPARKGLDY